MQKLTDLIAPRIIKYIVGDDIKTIRIGELRAISTNFVTIIPLNHFCNEICFMVKDICLLNVLGDKE